ncbi:MAG: YIP1 family protein [bacterium]
MYIGGALFRWTGRWLGGRAGSREIRAAIAWASVLAIWGMLFWVPQLLLFGKDMFTTETPRIDSSYLLTGLFWGLAAVEMVIGVWTIVAFLKCLGEVQGFSAWRALGSVLLSILAILVPILGIVMVMVLVKQLMPH